MSGRLRIWSEFVPYARLAARDVTRLLAERGVEVLVAVSPTQVTDFVTLASTLRDEGVGLGAWPLLADQDGRWLQPRNAARFDAHVASLFDALDARGLGLATVALDLEPAIEEVRGLLRGRVLAVRGLVAPSESVARRGLMARLERRVRGGDNVDCNAQIEVLAAVLPAVFARGIGGRGWQGAFDARFSELDRAGAVHAMLYTSLLEGYSKGFLRRDDARSVLFRYAKRAVERFGARAGIALGCVGKGALGDEQTYRSVEELADDVALARRAGATDLSVFDLGGMLDRGCLDACVEALVATRPLDRDPPVTPRGRIATLATYATGGLLHAVRRA